MPSGQAISQSATRPGRRNRRVQHQRLAAFDRQAQESTRRRRGTSSRPSRCTRSSRRGRRAAARRTHPPPRRTARFDRSASCSAVAVCETGLSILQQLDGPRAAAHLRQRPHEPQHAMRVLPAVFADARHVALDVARIVRRFGRTAASSKRIMPASSSTSRSSTACIASSARSGGATPESTAHAWASASIWHSSLVAEPIGWPLS